MSFEPPDVEKAVALLRAGGIVAFATETVYGLGADATNAAAVRRIFAAKGRPPTNPLIVHVADEAVARRYAELWPKTASTLARAFWPGPFTLIVRRASGIVKDVTAGLETVGLRAPDHPLALELLRAFDGPIAAPSANRSSRISPTTASHVREELGDRVDLILDGGPCRVGIESTVIDLTRAQPTILRPGAVTREQIEAHIGPVGMAMATVVEGGGAAMSPGQQAVHYAPCAPAYRFEVTDVGRFGDWLREHTNDNVTILALEGSALLTAIGGRASSRLQITEMPFNPGEYARRLYSELRVADERSPVAIWIEMPPDTPDRTAIRDRIRRATRLP